MSKRFLCVFWMVALGSVEILADEAEQIFRIASHFQVQRQYDRAASSYRHLIETHPSSLWADDAQFHLAEVLHRQGKVKEAVQEYERLRVVYPHGEWTSLALYVLGSHYSSLGDEKNLMEAVDRFQGVVKLKSDGYLCHSARMAMGDCLLRLGRVKEAAYQFQELLDSPFAAQAHFYLGSLLTDPRFEGRDLTGAANHFRTIVDRFPQSPNLAQTLWGLGECYRELGQLEDAVKCYERVLLCEGLESWIWKSFAQEQLHRILMVGEEGIQRLQEVRVRPMGEQGEKMGVMDVQAEKIVYMGDVKLKISDMEILGDTVIIDLLDGTFKCEGSTSLCVDGKALFFVEGVSFTMDSLRGGDMGGVAAGNSGEGEAVTISGLGHAGGLIPTGTNPVR